MKNDINLSLQFWGLMLQSPLNKFNKFYVYPFSKACSSIQIFFSEKYLELEKKLKIRIMSVDRVSSSNYWTLHHNLSVNSHEYFKFIKFIDAFIMLYNTNTTFSWKRLKIELWLKIRVGSFKPIGLNHWFKPWFIWLFWFICFFLLFIDL